MFAVDPPAASVDGTGALAPSGNQADLPTGDTLGGVPPEERLPSLQLDGDELLVTPELTDATELLTDWSGDLGFSSATASTDSKSDGNETQQASASQNGEAPKIKEAESAFGVDPPDEGSSIGQPRLEESESVPHPPRSSHDIFFARMATATEVELGSTWGQLAAAPGWTALLRSIDFQVARSSPSLAGHLGIEGTEIYFGAPISRLMIDYVLENFHANTNPWDANAQWTWLDLLDCGSRPWLLTNTAVAAILASLVIRDHMSQKQELRNRQPVSTTEAIVLPR